MHDVLKAAPLIPPAALESHVGILGKTGSGKSNLAKVIAERLMMAGERVCAIDPTGTWWGLRLSADGKKPSPFSPVIFGGDHGDIPLGEQHGAVLAEAIGTSGDSAVIDTQQMTVGQRTRFFGAFAEALLRANRGPLHLIIDEAHLFAPQGKVNDPQSGTMLHAANNLVSLGRGRGLRIMLISQRPAKLHKDSLTQVETLIAMRLIAPQDTKAVKEWIGEWADLAKGSEIIKSLPSLPRGDAWIWSPQLDYLERKHFPLAATFDSGTAEANAAARELPPIDVAKLGQKLDTIRQEAMANDPARLKKRIAELEKAKPQSVSAPTTPDPKLIEQAEQHGYERGVEAGKAAGLAEAKTRLQALADALPGVPVAVAARPAPAPRQSVPKIASPPVKRDVRHATSGEFNGPQMKVLRSLAMWKALGKDAPSKPMVAMCAGYSHSSGGFANLLGTLRTMGAIEYPTPGAIMLLTDAAEMDASEGKELFLGKLSGPQRKIVDALATGGEMSKGELGDATAYSATSGGFANLLGQLRTLGIIDYPSPGRVAMEPWVFDVL